MVGKTVSVKQDAVETEGRRVPGTAAARASLVSSGVSGLAIIEGPGSGAAAGAGPVARSDAAVKPPQELPPFKALVRVTTACDIACSHCYVNASRFKGERFEMGELKGVIDQLIGSGARKIIFTGGQPTLIGDDLFEAIRYAKDRSREAGREVSVQITTNAGFGPTPEVADRWVKRFKDAGLDQIRLSCDKWHRAFYPKRMEANIIKAARKNRMSIKIMNVVTTSHQIDENVETPERKTFALRPGGRAGKDSFSEGWDNIPKCRLNSDRESGKPMTIFIEPSRDVNLCNVDIHSGLSIGKMLDSSLGEMLTGESRNPVVRALAEGDVENLGALCGEGKREITDRIKEIGRCAACRELRQKGRKPAN